MSGELHVVYRHVGASSWEVYSRPVSIHTDGRTLQEAREHYADIAQDQFGSDWSEVTVIEHRELMVMPGVFIRIATDRHTLDREKVAQVFRASLTISAQWELLQNSDVPVSSTGDVVFLACVDSDPLDWVTSQLGRGDALQVACLRDANAVWWMPLAAPDAELNQPTETLAQAGLTTPSSTVADLMEVNTDPIVAPGVALPASSGSEPGTPARRGAKRRKKSGVERSGLVRSGLVRSGRRALVAA